MTLQSFWTKIRRKKKEMEMEMKVRKGTQKTQSERTNLRDCLKKNDAFMDNKERNALIQLADFLERLTIS